ncbi:MAG: radical SAM protein [bacterium]
MWTKALLIVPPTGKYIREERCQTPLDEMHTIALRPPMDLLYMAGALEKKGVVCQIRDYPAIEVSWDSFRRDIVDFQPDALVLSITTPTLSEDLIAARIAKEINPAIITISKGAHFSQLDLEALEQHPRLDIAIRGEYEETICDLAAEEPLSEIPGITHRADGQPVRTPDRPFIADLDRIPFPARHLIDNRLYFRPDTGALQATIVTSRGCPYPCVFCLAGHVAGKKARVRSPENVIAEIRECIDRHGIRDFLFRSDLFTANRKWVLDLCAAIRELGVTISWSCNSRVDTIDEEILDAMKAAGCWLIAFGVESGSPALLEKMRKATNLDVAEQSLRLCRKAGIKSSIYFVIGLPWETRETFEESVRFAKRIDPDFLEVFFGYPFYGTEFYSVAVQEGLLKEGELPLQGYNHPSLPTLSMSMEELAGLRTEFLRSFYVRPGFILRTLLNTRSPKILKNYLVYGWRQMKDLLISDCRLRISE